MFTNFTWSYTSSSITSGDWGIGSKDTGDLLLGTFTKGYIPEFLQYSTDFSFDEGFKINDSATFLNNLLIDKLGGKFSDQFKVKISEPIKNFSYGYGKTFEIFGTFAIDLTKGYINDEANSAIESLKEEEKEDKP